MAGTVTATLEKGLNGVYTFNSATAAGENFAVGTVGLGTYTGGGMTWVLPFNNVDFVMVENASSAIFQYDKANTKLKIYDVTASTTGTIVELASDTDVTSLTSVAFVAFGH